MSVYEFYKNLPQQADPNDGRSREELYEPSITVPDMDLSPQEIIERHVRHLPIPIAYRPTFVIAEDGSEDDEALDFEPCEDEFDIRARLWEEKRQLEEERRKKEEENKKPIVPPVTPPEEEKS